MKITASAISLNVDAVTASTTFVKQHFGFSEQMSADGFVSLSRQDAGLNLVFLRTGLETNGIVIQLVQWVTNVARID